LRNLVLAGGLLGTVPAAGDHVDGAWTEVHDWPLIAIHAALTPDGRVLTYGTTGSGTQTGYFIYDIWDPMAGLTGGHLTLDNMTLTDIFCSSQIVLPQSGDILIVGGDNWTGNRTTNTGNNNSNLFDYGDNTLARSQNMNRARWYSSATALVSGEIYIQGGTGGADFPEVRQLNGNFRLLSNVPTSSYAVLFPRNFLAPDGRVFGYDTSGKMYYVNAVGTGSITSSGQFASSNAGWTSSAAMFAPGKILQMGGNSNGAMVIDINGPQPLVTTTQSMSSKRMWVSATVLPDGQVLATAGSEVENQLAGVNNSAEIWNPATGEWHLGSAGEKARLYHNTALLLPDATVLVAGGGAPGPLNNTNAEVYYPPYLFDVNDNLAVRPAILSAPDTANVGDAVSIEVDTTDIARVTLVKTGSVTHSVNMDQRFLELPFTASANMLEATLPERASDTPPGFYQLFVLDDAGVPSHGRMLRIHIDPTPDVSVDYTPTIGGGGGAPFLLACNADEILVGVHGRYATYVNQVGPQCVTMDQLGRWIGNPVDRPATGTTASGTAFSKTCPRDYAVSGFRGRSGQYVNQVEIECRALTPSGDLGGAGQFLGATGGAGGSAQGLLRCGTDNPAYALYGRSGGWLDAFGVQCRQGAITPISINSEPVIVNPGAQSSIVGLPASLQLAASDGDHDPLTFSATGLPPGLALNAGNGSISGTPTTAGTFNVTAMVSDGADLDTANFNWHIATVEPLFVPPMPLQDPVIAGTPVGYAATTQGGFNPVYKWNFGDGTLETAWSSSSSVEHVFPDPGIYYVTLTVNDDFNDPQVQTFQQTVHLPLTAGQPTRSSRIVYEDAAVGNNRLWVVNSDNDTVSVFAADSGTKLAEIEVGSAPRTLAAGPNGRIWVANGLSHDLSVIDSTSFAVLQTVALPHGSEPYGIAISPVAGEVFVVLAATGQLLKLDASNGATLGTVNVGPKPRHLAVNADGSSVYVSRFITGRQPGEETAQVLTQLNGVDTGGELRVVNPATMTVTDTVVLRHSLKFDAENQGSGVPNYLGALAISPDGTHGWVPSKQDNIGRGTLRNGSNLNFQNTVRAISSRVELPGLAENYASRMDLDNASVASAAAFDPLGIYLFVALETSREVAVIDVHGNAELFRVDVGRAPQGLVLSSDGLTLYVSNFMDRNVDVFDLTELRTEGQWNIPHVETLQSVASETLTPEVLAGKQLFYDARDPRLALDRYMSCASCHNDGGGDGRVWDLTGMGEGLRNTISLMGAGPEGGPLHWSQNFDEVQDFEGQIRTLAGGTGLMTNAEFNAGTREEPLGDPKAGVSADLDALAAYVNSLRDETSSPQRLSDSSLTAFATEGREVFRRENCAACHSGVAFSDSGTNTMHDIGTIKPASGLRLGQPLTGVDTPTLRGVRKSAPYLHDGSAASLADAVAAHQAVSLNVDDLSALVAYLEQIDVNEQSAPLPNVPPDVTNPGPQTYEVESRVSLAIVASDPDEDVLSYSASGLPPGLSISVISGLISGTPAAVGNYVVTVTVDDGADQSSVEFNWEVSEAEAPPEAPNQAPAVANPGDQSSEQNESVSLGVVASDPDGDTLAYSAGGLPSGLSIDSANGIIGGTPTTVGIYAVVVSVQDGTASTSIEFEWEVTAAVEEPPEEIPPGAESPEREETSGGGGIGALGIAVLALFALFRRAAGRIALLVPVVALSATTLAATTSLPQLDRVRILQSPVVIPDATLTDQHGELVSLDELRGKVALVFFGFTNCPDVCPMAMQSLRQLERTSEFDRDEVAYVLVSVDGDRDTPEAMKAFLAKYSPSFIGLTAEPAAVKLIASEFRASFFKGSPTGQGNGYDVSHSPQLFVVDAEGRLRAEFYNASNEAMKTVVSALIDEAATR
jgi:YVTN family beta-propeller protein